MSARRGEPGRKHSNVIRWCFASSGHRANSAKIFLAVSRSLLISQSPSATSRHGKTVHCCNLFVNTSIICARPCSKSSMTMATSSGDRPAHTSKTDSRKDSPSSRICSDNKPSASSTARLPAIGHGPYHRPSPAGWPGWSSPKPRLLCCKYSASSEKNLPRWSVFLGCSQS